MYQFDLAFYHKSRFRIYREIFFAALLVVISVVFSVYNAAAQRLPSPTLPPASPTPSSRLPVIKQLRYDEDNEYFCRAENRNNFYARLKCILLRESGNDDSPKKRENYFLSFGGEIREQAEYYDYPSWGAQTPHNGYLLQRYMLHADLRLGSRVRFFGQFKSGIERGRKGGARPIDVDKFDLHQAFIDVVMWRKDKESLSLRAGRQEMAYGASRLVSFREGPNVRQSFDGVRATLQKSDWKIDAFVVKPVETNRGYFDDAWENGRTFWGIYAVRPLKIIPKAHVDLYYFGLDRKASRFQQGTGREQRQTVGARVWGANKNWDHDNEFVLQFGKFGARDIRAWEFSTNNGYTFVSALFHPRIGIGTGVASGDRNPNDRKVNTFNALFPTGSYFGKADLVGPYNVIAVRPSIEFTLRENIKFTPDYEFFWRESAKDGIYGLSGNLIRSSGISGARYIGSHLNLDFEWKVNRNLTFNAVYLHFFSGRFLRETGAARDVNFGSAWLTYKF